MKKISNENERRFGVILFSSFILLCVYTYFWKNPREIKEFREKFSRKENVDTVRGVIIEEIFSRSNGEEYKYEYWYNGIKYTGFSRFSLSNRVHAPMNIYVLVYRYEPETTKILYEGDSIVTW